MARRSWFLHFLTLTSSIPIAFSATVGLGSDIALVVPSCAQPCLLSFIPSNFPTANCGTDLTLPCLCPTRSTSGFTVGEVALQCLIGSTQLGQCGDSDVDASTPARVYNMCQGQKDALPNTHSALTATLLVPPTGAPSLVAPEPTTQPTLGTGTTAKPTITPTPTTMRTITMVSSPAISKTSTIMPSDNTSLASSTITPTMIAAPPTSSQTTELSSTGKLARAQIAGITVGVVGAVILAVVVFLLAKWVRRRRNHGCDSEKAIYPNDDSALSLTHAGSRSSHIFHISPPVLRTSRYRPDFSPRPVPSLDGVLSEMPAQPASAHIDKNTIGLALTRPRSWILPRPSSQPNSSTMTTPVVAELPAERRKSKLLPPRPTLTLEIPPKAAVAEVLSPQAPRTAADRGSTMTVGTAFADLDSAAVEGGQIWRPPPSDPLSASTLYFADKYGNWVLRSDKRRSQTAPATEGDDQPSYSLPTSPAEKEVVSEMPAMVSPETPFSGGSQPPYLSQSGTSWKNPQASTSYSQPSTAQQFGKRGSSRNNRVSKSRKSYSGAYLGRSDSVTTIQTTSTGFDDNGGAYVTDIARLSQLTPVQESPDPGARRPRVNYPKIPGRLDGATIRFVPPPKRPNFESLSNEPSGSNLGTVSADQDSASPYPPPLNPRRHDKRLTATQGSGSGFSPELPNIEIFPVKTQLPANEMYSPGTSESQDSQQSDAYESPLQQSIPRSMRQQHSFAEKRSLTSPQRGEADNDVRNLPSQRNKPGMSSGAGSLSTSSLLAKRLGNDRAAALVIDPSRKKTQNWRRNDDGGRVLSPDGVSLASSRGTLPQTPKWQPKLTPTRRGDDLYLDVQ